MITGPFHRNCNLVAQGYRVWNLQGRFIYDIGHELSASQQRGTRIRAGTLEKMSNGKIVGIYTEW